MHRYLPAALAFIACLAWADVPPAQASSGLCERVTAHFTSARTLKARESTRQLERLQRHAPRCLDAVRAAYRCLIAHWDEAVVAPSLNHTRPVMEANWRRFNASHRFIVALAAFKRASVHPDVLVALGKHYEAMAIYYNETGYMPDGVVVSRSAPESLYHQRAVDAAEDLLTRAERAYSDALNEMNIRGTDLARMATVRDLYLAVRRRHAERARSDARTRARAIRATGPPAP